MEINTILNCNMSTLRVFKLNYKKPLTLTFDVEKNDNEIIVKIIENKNILGTYRTNDVETLVKMFFIKLAKFNSRQVLDIDNNVLLKNNLIFTMYDIIDSIFLNKIKKVKDLLGLSFKELSDLLGIPINTLRVSASKYTVSKQIERILDLTLENIELKKRLNMKIGD